jgi:cardiolipin synthase
VVVRRPGMLPAHAVYGRPHAAHGRPDLTALLETYLPHLQWLLGAAITAFSLWTAGHALYRRRSPRTAVIWVFAALVFPLVGAAAYWLIGQNRIFYRANKLRRRFPSRERLDQDQAALRHLLAQVAKDEEELATLLQIERVGNAATGLGLTSGNWLEPLENGEQCYPRLFAALDGARETIDLCSYLVDGPRMEQRLSEALIAAHRRGVEVRMLFDGLGELFGGYRVKRRLRAAGVPCASFLPLSLSERGLHLNLRNHRKILVVDGCEAFTGGMNLRDCHEVTLPGKVDVVRDVHFALRGPVVAELEQVFLEDWAFATETRAIVRPRRAAEHAGRALCRSISEGPNEDYGAFNWVLLGAIASARERVRLVTPYFIPTEDLESALIIASLRGLRVEVMLPGTPDHPYTHWAMRAMVRDLLRKGVEVRLQPPPFTHTKLVLVDRLLVVLGSANLDPRSLRLNFEFNLAVYDAELAAGLNRRFEEDWAKSTPLTIADLDRDSSLARFRNHLARLAGPYL